PGQLSAPHGCVNVNVVPGTSAIVFEAPVSLAALMSAIRSATLPAVKLEGTVLSSNCSRPRRTLRRRGSDWRDRFLSQFFNHIAILLSRKVCDTMFAAQAGAQTERRGSAGPARSLLGSKTAPAACSRGSYGSDRRVIPVA